MSESQLTVEELIKVLKKFPQNFRVMVYRYNGNYEEQEPVKKMLKFYPYLKPILIIGIWEQNQLLQKVIA